MNNACLWLYIFFSSLEAISFIGVLKYSHNFNKPDWLLVYLCKIKVFFYNMPPINGIELNGLFFFFSKSPFPLFEDFFFAHTWTLHLFSSCNKWRWWSINTKLRCSSSFYRSTDPWSSCTFLFCFTLSLLISTHSCSVVKSSRLPANIAAYLVSIGRLLCLAFLYGWRFLIKISLDWPLTLTTQPSTSKLSDNRVLGPPDPVILLNASIAIGIPILASNDPRNPPVCVFVGFTITFPPDCTALLFLR